jgi:hypothetical protein
VAGFATDKGWPIGAATAGATIDVDVAAATNAAAANSLLELNIRKNSPLLTPD